MISILNMTVAGAVIMAGFTVSLFFLRFWKTTGDRFFLFFASSFFVEAMSRVLLVATRDMSEFEPVLYCLRLVSFLIIVYAIADKNRAKHSAAIKSQ